MEVAGLDPVGIYQRITYSAGQLLQVIGLGLHTECFLPQERRFGESEEGYEENETYESAGYFINHSPVMVDGDQATIISFLVVDFPWTEVVLTQR